MTKRETIASGAIVAALAVTATIGIGHAQQQSGERAFRLLDVPGCNEASDSEVVVISRRLPEAFPELGGDVEIAECERQIRVHYRRSDGGGVRFSLTFDVVPPGDSVEAAMRRQPRLSVGPTRTPSIASVACQVWDSGNGPGVARVRGPIGRYVVNVSDNIDTAERVGPQPPFKNWRPGYPQVPIGESLAGRVFERLVSDLRK